MNHFAVHLKLTKHYKSTILQYKIKIKLKKYHLNNWKTHLIYFFALFTGNWRRIPGRERRQSASTASPILDHCPFSTTAWLAVNSLHSLSSEQRIFTNTTLILINRILQYDFILSQHGKYFPDFCFPNLDP